MTPTPLPPTRVVVEIDGEREVLDGREAAIIAKLLEPKWRQAILAAEGKVKITIDCKGSSIIPSITIF